MTGQRRLAVLLSAVLVVLAGYLFRRKGSEETAEAIQRSSREARSALEQRADESGSLAEDGEISAVIEAAASAAAGESAPPATREEESCIQDVAKDAESRLGANPEFPGQTTRTESLEDVDGDDRPEELVSFRELCGVRNCTWAMYATNEGCSRYVGRFEGAAWTTLASSHHDLRDVATTWVAGCAGAQRYEAVLEFDGLEYREASRAYVDECSAAGSPR